MDNSQIRPQTSGQSCLSELYLYYVTVLVRWRRRKRLQDGTALITAGCSTSPTALTNRPAGNIGDGRGPHSSVASSPTPTAPTTQPAGSLGDNQGPHPSMAENLIDLDSPATTSLPASGEIQGLMAN